MRGRHFDTVRFTLVRTLCVRGAEMKIQELFSHIWKANDKWREIIQNFRVRLSRLFRSGETFG